MAIRIVTDSSCDLPQAIIEMHRITVVPLYIHIGNQDYLDGIDITRQEFYDRLPALNPTPKTAAPGLETFRQVYEGLAADGASEILSIHISIKLSATVEIARAAAGETSAVPVTVFDSRQLSLGTGFLVETAARAASEGRSLAEILALLEEQISRTHVFAALDTLKFLQRSGRMNFVLSTFGSLLSIKPILRMEDGEPTAERVRTRAGAMRRLVELLRQYGPFERVAMLHSHAAGRAQDLLQEVRSLLPEGEIWLEEITPVLGAHIGPGVIGFVCLSKNMAGGQP
jgi:DegV family protein with EDD domain